MTSCANVARKIDVRPNLLNRLLDSDSILEEYLTKLASCQTEWTDSGWAGYLYIFPSNISFSYSIPSSDVAGAKAQMADWFDYLTTNPKYTVTFQKQTSFSTFQDLIDTVIFPIEHNTPGEYRDAALVLNPDLIMLAVGFGTRLSGRLIPRSLFANTEAQKSLAKAITQGRNINSPLLSLQTLFSLFQPLSIMIMSTGPPKELDNSKTGVNPAWRGSLWQVIFMSGWTQGNC